MPGPHCSRAIQEGRMQGLRVQCIVATGRARQRKRWPSKPPSRIQLSCLRRDQVCFFLFVLLPLGGQKSELHRWGGLWQSESEFGGFESCRHFVSSRQVFEVHMGQTTYAVKVQPNMPARKQTAQSSTHGVTCLQCAALACRDSCLRSKAAAAN